MTFCYLFQDLSDYNKIIFTDLLFHSKVFFPSKYVMSWPCRKSYVFPQRNVKITVYIQVCCVFQSLLDLKMKRTSDRFFVCMAQSLRCLSVWLYVFSSYVVWYIVVDDLRFRHSQHVCTYSVCTSVCPSVCAQAPVLLVLS